MSVEKLELVLYESGQPVHESAMAGSQTLLLLIVTPTWPLHFALNFINTTPWAIKKEPTLSNI